jgi:hypothetical protein
MLTPKIISTPSQRLAALARVVGKLPESNPTARAIVSAELMRLTLESEEYWNNAEEK